MKSCEDAMAGHDDDPVAALYGFIDANLDKQICSPNKAAVWYSYWGDSQARDDYSRICGHSDSASYEAVYERFETLAEAHGRALAVEPRFTLSNR